jgi:glycosyltransferase involved in cell wall biosynthesis
MHIVVFYQYYHNPDCPAAARHYTLMREWSRSHRVTVITGNSWHRRRLSHDFDWAPPGVDVKMIDVDYDNAMSTPARLKSFGRYALGALSKGIGTRAPDIIFGTSTPLTAAWAASKVARLRRIKWIFEVRDLWPDFPIQMGAIKNPTLERMLRRMEENLYRSAAHIIPLSPDMTRHIAGCGIESSKITTILNGTDFDLLDSIPELHLADLRDEYGLAGKKVVLYAGTFGRANDVRTMLSAATALEDRNDIRFVFLGTGAFEAQVRSAARSSTNMVAPDPLPRHRILTWFRMADISLCPFIDLPVLAANSPSKFFDSLGAGTPIIVTNPGWTRAFVEEHECGWYVPPTSPSALAARLREVLDSPWDLARAGMNARRVAADRFDRIAMAAQIERIMAESMYRP